MLISDPFTKDAPREYRIALGNVPGGLDVIEIGHNIVPKGFQQVMRRDVYILHYITKGRGNFCGQDFSEKNGYLVCPAETEIVVADEEDPYEAYWIMVRKSAFLNFMKICGLPNSNGVFSFEKTQECAAILKHALFEITPANEYEESAMMNAALYRIMAIHLRQLQKAPFKNNISQMVKSFIDANFSKNIRVDALAKEFNFSRNYLYTLFKKDYGISPQMYLLNLRMEKAKELLKDDHSVKNVALAVGYDDQFYFSRIFRQKTGLSPKAFSKMYKRQ